MAAFDSSKESVWEETKPKENPSTQRSRRCFMEDLYESVPYSYSCRAGIDVEQA